MTFWRNHRCSRILNKVFSVLIIQSFIFSSIAFAVPTQESTLMPSSRESVTNPDSVVIPRDFGLVKSKFSGDKGKLVIHIQDAHCNYEAQSNIVKILDGLIKNYKLSFIAVEGADGFIDTSWFKAFPDDEVRKEVANYFMKKGEITGPEYLSITSTSPVKLFGAETRSYYIQNLNAFTSSYPLKAETEKYFNQIKTVLNKLKIYIYNDDLKTLDAKMVDYEAKKIPFNDYARFLQDMAEKNKINLREYDNFFKLVSVLIYEKKIDFKLTDKERSALIDEVSKKISKETLTELVTKSLSFKMGKISSADYYGYLKGLALQNDIDLAKRFPNLSNYIIYNATYSKIENEKLFHDMKQIETALKEKLFANDDQRTLEGLSRHIDTLLGLVNIKLLNGDFDYYKNHKEEFSSEAFADFIKKKTVQYGLFYDIGAPSDAVASSIQKLEDFYSIAIKRDVALVDNTINAMKNEKVEVAVLVTGGFHSEGITKLLEKQGISYMVVCPTITKDGPTPYIQILTNQRTPIDDLLVDTAEAKEGMLAAMLITQLVGMSDAMLEEISGQVQPSPDAQTGQPRTVADRAHEFKQQNFPQAYAADVINNIRRNMAAIGALNIADTEGAFIAQIQQNCQRLHISDADRQAIITHFKAAFSAQFQGEFARLHAMMAKRQGARTSPGEHAVDVTGKKALEQQEFTRYDEVLSESFTTSDVETRDGDIQGLRVQIHGDEDGSFEDRIARINYHALENDQPTVVFSRIHPGTWRGRAEQIHVSRFIWSKLTGEDKEIVGNHEKAHLDIYKKRGNTYKLWQLYVRYCQEKKLSIDQEDFVDNIQRWADTLMAWANATAPIKQWARSNDIPLNLSHQDFPNCNTADIRVKIGRWQAERIFRKIQRAIDAKDEIALTTALAEAYVLAANYGDNQLLGRIIDLFATQPYKEKHGICRSALLTIAKWYPVWIRKDLFRAASPISQTLLDGWFTVSGAKADLSPKDVVAVIMAGGGGERMWPLSNRKKPKQTARIVDKELLLMAAERVVADLGARNVYIQTVPHLKDQVIALLSPLGIPPENIFTEPKAADTAGAIGYAAAKLRKMGRGEDVMFVGTADHYIDVTTSDFKTAYMNAAKIAKHTPSIGTLGIDPEPIGTSEEYGCIQKGEETFYTQEEARIAAEFIEKPKGAKAQQIFDDRLPNHSHRWLYNSGMFVGRPNIFLEAFRQIAPVYGDAFDAIAAAPDREADVTENRAFDQLADYKAKKGFPHSAEALGFRGGTSVDYVLAQPLSKGETDRIALFMIPGVFKWKDIGSTKSAYEYYRDDYLVTAKGAVAQGNVIRRGDAYKDGTGNIVVCPNPSNVTLEGCTNCFVLAEDPRIKITLRGLSNVAVTYNPDTRALMVSPINVKGESVKAVLEKIGSQEIYKGYATGELARAGLSFKLIVNSPVAKADVEIGAGAILDIETPLQLVMIPQAQNINVPEVIVSVSGINPQTQARIAQVRAETVRNRTASALAKSQAIFTAEAQRAKSNQTVLNAALGNLRQWLTEDRFIEYREALLDLVDLAEIDKDAAKELYDSFWRTLPFGTGGRRWKIGIGPNRMNGYMAAMTAQGHVEYLKAQYAEEVKRGDAVVGAWDVRAFHKYFAEVPSLGQYRTIIEAKCPALAGLSSEDLSKIAALVYAGNGIKYIHPKEMRSTPWLSFVVNRFSNIGPTIQFTGTAAKALQATQNVMAGIVLSSSHNPYDNNGTKFYENSGAQAPPQIVQRLMDLGDQVTMINYAGGDVYYTEGRDAAFNRAVAEGKVIVLEGDNLTAIDTAYIQTVIDEVRSVYTEDEWAKLQPWFAKLLVSFNAINGTGVTNLLPVLDRLRFQALRSKEDVPTWEFPEGYGNIPNPEAEKTFNTAMQIGVRRTLDWVFDKKVTTVKAVIDEDGVEIPISVLEGEKGSPFISTDELIDHVKTTRSKFIRGVVLDVNDGNEQIIRAFSILNNICLMTDPDADRVGLGMQKIERIGKNMRLQWVSANDNDESGIVLFRYRLEKLRDMAQRGELVKFIETRRSAVGKGPSKSGNYQLIMVNTVVSNPLERVIAERISEDIAKLTKGRVTVKVVTHHVGFKFTGEIIDIINKGAYPQGSITAEVMKEAGVNLDESFFVMSSEEGEGSLIGYGGSIDKDSGVTGLALATLTAEQLAQGRTMYEYLEETYKLYGYSKVYLEPMVMTGDYGFRMINENIMGYLRNEVLVRLSSGHTVQWGDFTLIRGKDHYDLMKAAYGPDPAAWPQAIRESVNIIEFEAKLPDGTKITIVLRPSGTEPKHKNVVAAVGVPLQPGEDLGDYIKKINGLNRKVMDEVMIACYRASEAEYDSAVTEMPGRYVVTNLNRQDLLELLKIFPIVVSCEAKLAVYFPLRDYIKREAQTMVDLPAAEYDSRYTQTRERIERYLVNFKDKNGIQFVEESVLLNLRYQIGQLQAGIGLNSPEVKAIYNQAVLWFGREIGERHFINLFSEVGNIGQGTLRANQTFLTRPRDEAAPITGVPTEAHATNYRRESPGKYAVEGAAHVPEATFGRLSTSVTVTEDRRIDERQLDQVIVEFNATATEFDTLNQTTDREALRQAAIAYATAARDLSKKEANQALLPYVRMMTGLKENEVVVDDISGDFVFRNPIFQQAYKDRGRHDATYMLSRALIPEDMISDRSAFLASQYEAVYNMLHIIRTVRTAAGAQVPDELHLATAFPGEPVYPGTNIIKTTGSHFQAEPGKEMDIKYVESGYGCQVIAYKTGQGWVVKLLPLYPGAMAVAFPGTIDVVMNFGNLIFADRPLPTAKTMSQMIADRLGLTEDFRTALVEGNKAFAENLPAKGMPIVAYVDGTKVMVRVNPLYAGQAVRVEVVSPFTPTIDRGPVANFAGTIFNPTQEGAEAYAAQFKGELETQNQPFVESVLGQLTQPVGPAQTFELTGNQAVEITTQVPGLEQAMAFVRGTPMHLRPHLEPKAWGKNVPGMPRPIGEAWSTSVEPGRESRLMAPAEVAPATETGLAAIGEEAASATQAAIANAQAVGETGAAQAATAAAAATAQGVGNVQATGASLVVGAQAPLVGQQVTQATANAQTALNAQAAANAQGIPLSQAISLNPVAVLGQGVVNAVGTTPILLKYLTPGQEPVVSDLSVQVHDTKNELWVVARTTVPNPRILCGFNPQIIGQYQEQYQENARQELLRAYRQAIGQFNEALQEVLQAANAQNNQQAVRVLYEVYTQGKYGLPLEEELAARLLQVAQVSTEMSTRFYEASRQLNSFYNFVPVQRGQVISIPRGTLHALLNGVEVIEPQIPGRTLATEDGPRFPIRYPIVTTGGNVVSINNVQAEEVFNALSLEYQPEPITYLEGSAERGTPVTVERLGTYPPGLEVHRIIFNPRAVRNDTTANGYHILVAAQGRATIKTRAGKIINIEEAREGEAPVPVIIPASTGAYEITSAEGAQIIKSFVPIHETLRGVIRELRSPIERDKESNTTLVLTSAGTTVERMEINTAMPIDPWIGERQVTFVVEEGRVDIEKNGQLVKRLEKGEVFTLTEANHVVVRALEGKATVKLEYPVQSEERPVFTALEAVRANSEVIRTRLEREGKKGIQILATADLVQALYRAGVPSTPGHKQNEIKVLESFLSQYLKMDVVITMGDQWEELVGRVNPDYLPVAWITDAQMKTLQDTNRTVLNNILKTLRIVPISQARIINKLKPGQGWFYVRELEALSLLLACTTHEDIADNTNIARDLGMVVNTMIDDERQLRNVTDLKPLLPVTKDDEIGNRLGDLINRLLITRPIKPFDPTSELHSRRQLLWSV